MKILIIGRSNVGKSSLFNRIAKRRKALVFDEVGITRDVLTENVHWWGHHFEIMDSGGLPLENTKDELLIMVKKKIELAIKQADAFVIVTDGRTGLHSEDKRAVSLVQKTSKPFTIFVNKVDNPKNTELQKAEFFILSHKPISGSVEQEYGVDELIEWIITEKKKLSNSLSQKNETSADLDSKASGLEDDLGSLDSDSSASGLGLSDLDTSSGSLDSDSDLEDANESAALLTEQDDVLVDENTSKSLEVEAEADALLSEGGFSKITKSKKISSTAKSKKFTKSKELNKNKPTALFVMGKANSGKSMLCNQILNEDRMIVCSQPGTTLDTVTEFFSKDKQSYSISDNPGSRKGKREEREKLSFAKSRTEIEKSHIILLVIDAVVGPSRQDTRLIQLCLEKRKPIVVVMNKMDLVRNLDVQEREQKRIELKRCFHFCEDLPVVYISAKTAYNKEKLFKAILDIKQKMHFKISTSKLNSFFTQTIKKAPSPVYGTSDVKFYYITQTNKTPPDFVAFANYPKGVTPAYRRFVINQMKENWNLQGIPIGFHILARK